MTRKRRDVSAEERALFEAVAKAAAPRVARAAKAKAAKAVSAPAGVDGNTAERLKRGALEPEARLDLHGLTEAAAHRTLITFLHGAAARHLRLVLIVTGNVRSEPDPFDLGFGSRPRGVLARMTPRWLKEPELARFVADIRSAHRKHGGAGALYVYLRKP